MKKIFLIGCLLLTVACNLPVSTPTADPASAETPPSPPTPDAATQSQSITETAVPAVEAPPLYFTDEFDAVTPFWEFHQTGGAQLPAPSLQNGALRIDIGSPDTWLIGIHNVHSYSSVFIRAKASISTSGSVGLICRYSEDGWFEFNVSSDGSYSVLLGQWLSSEVVKYLPVINDTSNQLTGGLPGEIGLFCEDNFLRLYADDTMIRRVEVTNYGLEEGNIGITASSFAEVPTIALFEWVSVADQ